MESLRPNEQRARNAVTLIWIMLGLEIISFISGFMQYELLQIAADGGSFTTAEAEANDTREQFIAIIYMITYIVSAVTFIQWFRRAYYNLHLRVNHLSATEGWAAGSWFTPVLNLYRPYQIMKEIYEETSSLLTQYRLNRGEVLSTGMVGLWWTFWIINNLIGQVAFRLPSDTVDELMAGTVAGMVGNVAGIPLALLAIKVIKDYAAVEPLLREIKEEEEEPKTDEADAAASAEDDHVE